MKTKINNRLFVLVLFTFFIKKKCPDFVILFETLLGEIYEIVKCVYVYCIWYIIYENSSVVF